MSGTYPVTPTTRFGHQRLDAYRVAMDLFLEIERMAARFPKGHAELKDQVRRAAAAVARNIAEGANRVHPRDKAARFMVARGEVGECEAALEMVSCWNSRRGRNSTGSAGWRIASRRWCGVSSAANRPAPRRRIEGAPPRSGARDASAGR